MTSLAQCNQHDRPHILFEAGHDRLPAPYCLLMALTIAPSWSLLLGVFGVILIALRAWLVLSDRA